MGLRPTRANENQRRHPQAGVHGDAPERSAGFVRHPRAGRGSMAMRSGAVRASCVTPAQAGVHVRKNWIPAYAGMTCVQ